MGASTYTLQNGWTSIEEIVGAKSSEPTGLRLDLGCGFAKPDAFIGIDNLIGMRTQIVDAANSPDVLMDLNHEPLPFPDESCDEVRASHFLEHSNLDHVIDESFRVLKPGGRFMFAVPYANSAEGMYPGHLIFLTERWFHENMNFQSKFEILEELYKESEYYKQLPRALRALVPFDLARKFLFNACWEMTIVAQPRK